MRLVEFTSERGKLVTIVASQIILIEALDEELTDIVLPTGVITVQGDYIFVVTSVLKCFKGML